MIHLFFKYTKQHAKIDVAGCTVLYVGRDLNVCRVTYPRSKIDEMLAELDKINGYVGYGPAFDLMYQSVFVNRHTGYYATHSKQVAYTRGTYLVRLTYPSGVTSEMSEEEFARNYYPDRLVMLSLPSRSACPTKLGVFRGT